MRSRPREAGGAILPAGAAAVLLVWTGCGLVGPADVPERRASDVPGPFIEEGPLLLCLGDRRIDAPGAPGSGGEAGSLGFCVPSDARAAPCSVDGECGDRERCVCGACRVPVCRTGSDCPRDQDCMGHGHRCQARCVADLDCGAGERCDPTTLGCAPACEADADCEFGEVCSSTRNLCITVTCDGSGCISGRRCDVQRTTMRVTRPAMVREPVESLWATVEGVGVVRFAAGPGPGYGSETGLAAVEDPVRDPSLWSEPGGGLLLVVGAQDGSALVAYTSPDGEDWTRLGPGPFLAAGDGWESGWIGRPSVLGDAGGWLVAYEGGPGAGIGLARLEPSGEAARISSSPALTPSRAGTEPHWSALEWLGAPFLFMQECTPGWTGVGLVFEARGLERVDLALEAGAPAEPNASVGYARLGADSTLEADPLNPIFTTMAGLAVTRGESTPALVCEAGTWILLYEASDPRSGLSEGLFRALPY